MDHPNIPKNDCMVISTGTGKKFRPFNDNLSKLGIERNYLCIAKAICEKPSVTQNLGLHTFLLNKEQDKVPNITTLYMVLET